MIIFLHGEDVFSSHQKLTAIRQRFLAKHRAENLIIKSAEEVTLGSLSNIFLTQTLLGGQRLIIFKNILSLSPVELKTAFLDSLKNQEISDTTIVMYESESFDKRQALYKFLNKPARAQEFLPLKGFALNQQISQLAAQYQLQLSPTILEQLLISSNGDLLSIDNELKKLSAFAQSRPLTPQDISALLPGNLNLNIFSALDALIKQDRRNFLNIFNQQLERGEDVVKILGALTYQLRSAVQVLDLVTRGVDANQIAQRAGLHPFAVKQNLALTRNLKPAQLIDHYQRLVQIDHQLKTGACAPEDIPSRLVVTSHHS